MNPGDGSMDGWSWSMQGRVTNTEAITQQINYASVNRGLSYETEGTNRNVPVNLATVAERDAAARPMANVFDTRSSGRWTFATEASTVLATTAVVSLEKPNGVRFAAGPAITPRHDAAYWDAATVGFDFSEADQVPPALFNRVLWTGLKGDKPYPEFERTR